MEISPKKRHNSSASSMASSPKQIKFYNPLSEQVDHILLKMRNTLFNCPLPSDLDELVKSIFDAILHSVPNFGPDVFLDEVKPLNLNLLDLSQSPIKNLDEFWAEWLKFRARIWSISSLSLIEDIFQSYANEKIFELKSIIDFIIAKAPTTPLHYVNEFALQKKLVRKSFKQLKDIVFDQFNYYVNDDNDMKNDDAQKIKSFISTRTNIRLIKTDFTNKYRSFFHKSNQEKSECEKFNQKSIELIDDIITGITQLQKQFKPFQSIQNDLFECEQKLLFLFPIVSKNKIPSTTTFQFPVIKKDSNGDILFPQNNESEIESNMITELIVRLSSNSPSKSSFMQSTSILQSPTNNSHQFKESNQSNQNDSLLSNQNESIQSNQNDSIQSNQNDSIQNDSIQSNQNDLIQNYSQFSNQNDSIQNDSLLSNKNDSNISGEQHDSLQNENGESIEPLKEDLEVPDDIKDLSKRFNTSDSEHISAIESPIKPQNQYKKVKVDLQSPVSPSFQSPKSKIHRNSPQLMTQSSPDKAKHKKSPLKQSSNSLSSIDERISASTSSYSSDNEEAAMIDDENKEQQPIKPKKVHFQKPIEDYKYQESFELNNPNSPEDVNQNSPNNSNEEVKIGNRKLIRKLKDENNTLSIQLNVYHEENQELHFANDELQKKIETITEEKECLVTAIKALEKENEKLKQKKKQLKESLHSIQETMEKDKMNQANENELKELCFMKLQLNSYEELDYLYTTEISRLFENITQLSNKTGKKVKEDNIYIENSRLRREKDQLFAKLQNSQKELNALMIALKTDPQNSKLNDLMLLYKEEVHKNELLNEKCKHLSTQLEADLNEDEKSVLFTTRIECVQSQRKIESLQIKILHMKAKIKSLKNELSVSNEYKSKKGSTLLKPSNDKKMAMYEKQISILQNEIAALRNSYETSQNTYLDTQIELIKENANNTFLEKTMQKMTKKIQKSNYDLNGDLMNELNDTICENQELVHEKEKIGSALSEIYNLICGAPAESIDDVQVIVDEIRQNWIQKTSPTKKKKY